ncbi:MAG: hypothetical protein JXQ91_10430 [Vannielia sp.]|uniref:hypothetical protein n=1 Tax=Vannielia sp. TaxID=2813045 RepID=UPI003B8E9C0B
MLTTGEHSGFTRIALGLQQGTDWKVGRTEGGYVLELARRDIALDMSIAFRRIRRDRIQNLAYTQEAGRLIITSDCACHIRPVQTGTQVVAIDIVDGAAPPAQEANNRLMTAQVPPTETASPSAEPIGAPAPVAVADGVLPPMFSGKLRRRYDRHVALPNMADQPPKQEEPTAPARGDPGTTDPFAEAKERQRIAEIEAELLKQLARAGSQGMVKPNPDYGGLDGEVAQPGADMPPSNHPGENVGAITGVDRAAPNPAEKLTETATACLDPRHFDFLISEPEAKPHEMIGTARQALLREFDTPNSQAAAALARSYLYLGFGAEARQVVDDFMPDALEAPLYRALAAGLDDMPEKAGPALVGHVGCPGQASFWAMLTGPVPATLSDDTSRDIAATASDLPLHLRRLVVPRVAQSLLARNHVELAASLRDTLSRADGDHGSGYQMLQAALAEDGDHAAGGEGFRSQASNGAAEDLLEGVLESNQAEVPEALVELVRLANEQGRPLAPDRIDLVESIIFEHRDRPLAYTLMVAIAPAYARDGNFDKAFERLTAANAHTPGANPASINEARDTVSLILAKNASDEVFLRTLFDPAFNDLHTQVSDEPAFALASRLLSLGFPEQALQRSDGLPPEDAYRLMRVRALMALGRYERALASLAGLQGPESDALRGELLARLGEHDRAHTMSRVAGDEDAARRAAWASGNTEAIRESGTETEAGFSEAVQAENAPVAPAEPSLAGTEELLQNIRQRRSAIETLLQEKSSATGALSPSQNDPEIQPGA